MKPRRNLQAVGLAIAVLLLCTAPALASTIEERLQTVLSKIEAMVTKLALDDSLDAQEMETLRSELAEVYRELQELKPEITIATADTTPSAAPEAVADTLPAQQEEPAAENQQPTQSEPPSVESAETEQPTPNKTTETADKSQWLTYAKAKAVITPPDAKFDGWQNAADINFRWGEYGQIILEIANDGYHAQWTIDEAYHGNVNVSTQSQPEGNIVVQVDDEHGSCEFLLQNGGLGPLHYRQTKVNELPPSTPAPQPAAIHASAQQTTPTLTGVWYLTYREQVAGGNLAGSEILEWFITQYESGEYENRELARLGDVLRGLNGDARESLGQLEYVNEGQPRTITIPDPRINPVSFIQLMNKVYWLHTAGMEYTFDMN